MVPLEKPSPKQSYLPCEEDILPCEEANSNFPGRGLAVNFRKKCGEMRLKKIIFTAYFLHLFCGECGESR